MRKTLCFLLALAALPWLGGQALQASSCSCSAPDGTCSASVTCSGGCSAVCGSGGSCSAVCAGGDGGGVDQNFSITNGSGLKADELSRLLSEHSKRAVVFVSNDPRETLAVDFKQVSLADVRQILAKRGVLAAASKDGSRFSVETEGAPAAAVAAALKAITGGRFELSPSQAQARISLDIKGAQVGELGAMLAGFGQVRTVAREK